MGPDRFKKWMWKNSAGNTMAEYVVIGSLVAVVSIVAVVGAGNQIKAWLTGLKSDLRGNIAAADLQKQLDDLAKQRLVDATNALRKKTTSSLSDVVKGYEEVCVTADSCVRIPIVEGGTVQTAGGNGGQLTAQFSKVLSDLADQLESDPEADPTLVGMIRNLANQGHAMGDYQTTSLKGGSSTRQDNVMQQCNGGGDNSTCTSVTSDGRQVITRQEGGSDNGYMVKEVASSPYTNYGGISALGGGATASTTDANLAKLQGPMLSSFQKQFQAINDYISRHPDSISEAAVNLVTQETNQITSIVKGYKAVSNEQATVSTVTSGGGDNASAQDVVNTTTTTSYTTNAHLTHQSSNTICKSGAEGKGCKR